MRNGFKANFLSVIESFVVKSIPKQQASNPFILLGESECTIYIKGMEYKTPTFKKAVDTFFKSSFVFNLGYPPKAKHVFTFIQRCLYKIELPDQYTSDDLKVLASEFI